MKPRNFLAGWLGFIAQRAWVVAGVPLIVSCCAPIAGAQSCAPAPSGLVSWWRGEGNALDAAGINPGSFLNGASYASGEAGQAFNFTASGSHVRVPASPTLDVGAGNGLTVEAWINPADLSTPGPIAEWVLNGAYAVHFYATVSFSSGCLYADLVSTNGTEHIIQTGASVLSANAYQHVALTYDKASGVARLFRNGVIVQESNLGTFAPRTSSDLYLGYRPASSPGGPASFRGQIDEVSVHDRSLSTAEIQAIYNAGSAGKCVPTPPPPPTNGLVAYYPFNGNANDASGNGDDGIVNGATLTTDRFGSSNSAYSFDGVSSDILVPETLFGPTDEAWTVSLWITTDNGPYTVQQDLFFKSCVNGEMSLDIKTGLIGFRPKLASSGYMSVTAPVHSNSVMHLVGIYQKGQSISLYTNGVLAANLAVPNENLWVQALPLKSALGAYHYTPSPYYHFRGVIDDVTVYNRALSAAEVQQLYSPEPALSPQITTQPQDQTVVQGDTATFTVVASGSPAPNYQWRFNGTNIAGATGSALVLNNVQATNAGVYSVTVYNYAGTTNSSNAVLTVNVPPLITDQPQGTVGYWGGTVHLGVGVEGTPEFSYLWHKGNFAISWGTNATLTLTNLEFTDAGSYWVAVTNICGSTNSASALLVVNPAGVWLGTHPFLTITGTVGKTFGIEYTTQVSQTNSWTALTNIRLTEPVQEWIDTSVNAVVTPTRFYRVVPIP